MKQLSIVIAWLLLVLESPAEVDFAHQIVPILRENCAKCHLDIARKGGLSMNTRELLVKGSEDGEVVKPGDAEHSSLIDLILSDDKTERMPPKGERLTTADVAVLRDWINGGLKWEPGFTFAKDVYEPPLKPRLPELPPAVDGRSHPVDRIIDRYFAKNHITRPAPLADAAFIRRLSLDLTGLLPAPDAITAFVHDADPAKRAKLIDSTLARDQDYAEHWLSFWNDLLRNDYQGTGYIDGGRKQVTKWLYDSLLENKPYDRFARELLDPPDADSQGFIDGIRWRGTVNASQTREVQFSQSISQTFLGLNMKCASCHDSFVDRWKLDDAYGLAAIYSDHPLEIERCDKPTGRMAKPAWIFPEIGQVDAGAARPERLKQLAALMTHPENGRFSRTIVNRLWQRLMGRGIVHPVDSMGTPPWDADLLDFLAVRFVKDGYDLKKSLAFIASSQAYQSESVVTGDPVGEKFFRGPVARKMTAEQFVDAVWTLTGTAPTATAPGLPRKLAASSETLSAQWIWSLADAGAVPAGEKISLATAVDLPAAPTSVRAVFVGDNETEIFLNGQSVAKAINGPVPQTLDFSGLKVGHNTLLAVVKNAGTAPNPAGLILEAKVTFADGKILTISSDPSWKWSRSLPDATGKFDHPPTDWLPAIAISKPAVWAGMTAALPALLNADPTMVRASLVPADLLMRALGRPNREQIVSMRPDNITTLEAIDLANGNLLAGLISRGAKTLVASRKSPEAMVDHVYLQALGRLPGTAEKAGLIEMLGKDPGPRAVEDLLWLVLMLPEFQFVR